MKKLIYSKEDLDLILSIELQNQEQEIERLNNIIKTKDEGIKALTKELCDTTSELGKRKKANRKLQRIANKNEIKNFVLKETIKEAIEYIKDNPKLVNDKLYQNDKDTSFIFINNKIKSDLLCILEGVDKEGISKYVKMD